MITDHAQVRLEWNNRTSHLTVPLDKHSNVANICQSPGYHKYKLFLQQAKMEDETHDKAPVTLLEVMGTNIVSDEESQGSTQPDEQDCNTGWSVEDPEGEPREITFDLTPNDQATSETRVAFNEQEDPADNLAAELLRVHHQFNHIGFAKLKLMAKSGILPKRLANALQPGRQQGTKRQLCPVTLPHKSTTKNTYVDPAWPGTNYQPRFPAFEQLIKRCGQHNNLTFPF